MKFLALVVVLRERMPYSLESGQASSGRGKWEGFPVRDMHMGLKLQRYPISVLPKGWEGELHLPSWFVRREYWDRGKDNLTL